MLYVRLRVDACASAVRLCAFSVIALRRKLENDANECILMCGLNNMQAREKTWQARVDRHTQTHIRSLGFVVGRVLDRKTRTRKSEYKPGYLLVA